VTATPPLPDLNALDERQRIWLGLLALMPGGVGGDVLDRMARSIGPAAATPLAARDLVDGFARLGIEIAHVPMAGMALGDVGWRRAGLAHLIDSGIAQRWLATFNPEQQELLRNRHHAYQLPRTVVVGMRLALLAGAERKQIARACALFNGYEVESALVAASFEILVAPVDDAQMLRLHPSVRLDICLRQLAADLRTPDAGSGFWHRHALVCIDQTADPVAPNFVLAQHALLRGDLDEAERFGGADIAVLRSTLEGVSTSDRVATLTALQATWEAQVARAGHVRPPLFGSIGVLHALALAAEPTAPNLAWLTKLARGQEPNSTYGFTEAVAELGGYARVSALALPWAPKPALTDLKLFVGWVQLLLCQWSGMALPPALAAWARRMLPHLADSRWHEMANHFAASLGDADAHPTGAWLWRQPEAPWQRALRAIETYVKPASERKVASKYSRIRVNLMPHYAGPHLLSIEVRELRPTSKSGWTGGRLLDTARLAEDARTRVDPDDLRAIELLTQWRRRSINRFDEIELNSLVVDALIDYPHVVTGADDDRPLRVIRHTPRLLIRRDRDGRACVQLDPSPAPDARRSAEWTREALVLTDFDADTLRLAAALGGETSFPEVALPALLALAPQLSRRIEVDTDFGMTAIAADVDARIHVLIEPLKEGLRLRLRTRPLGVDGIYFVPAVGGTEILGLRDGTPVRARRVLADEQRELDHLLQQAPLLAGGEHGDDVDIPAAEMALEALSQLVELGERVLLDWSQHRRWSLTRRQSMGQLSLKVRAQRDWFHAEGGLKLDDGQVVSLASLLEALPSSQGRFVRLADERIIALSQELAKQLRQVRALADNRGRLELAPVAATALQPLIDAGADVDLDQAFAQQLERIAAADEIHPEVPANLDAELRDYQIEGFRWLMRLASWGAGACLADDMGLGKTLQALALLLARAPAGPAIVVAPTSVVANWRSEAQRFAPSLELRVYGDGDRAQMLDQLGPGCVLLISYGLLTLNIDSIAEIRFATLVMDEAQAIKNAAAQRTLAIRRVHADFRIATTGTPIENHLGELWSLMRVLNPGLLGSQEHFAKRFMAPIERNSRGPERETLRRLIGPFMLRRLKSQVLAELPPRTEIVLTIEPSPGEAKLLAAVRRQAIERLETGGLPEEAKRFHVLAEITRLRRAACHPSLVAPELNLTGAKLEQLLELVAELKENRHRALVFSQFVDYLSIVRAAFDQAGISYQYLDGSTSPKAREAAVNAFQGGSGDVFLLSLKAGGVGLNLTAADYVIHLDPWWNPAVEQQATDRAHRIGQTRPVTVYKLVVKGSIEEQILALHGSKREIADSVLADQDTATRMNVGELIGLLQMG
jgi:superfamily II DNA or RNA helicase